jgi:hypothetical protein
MGAGKLKMWKADRGFGLRAGKDRSPLERIHGRRQREPGCDQQGRCCDVAMGDSRWPKINCRSG